MKTLNLGSTKGFTLVELLVVIFIIVLLCGLALPMLDLFTFRSSVEHGGRVTITAFVQARQWATAQRLPHLMTFGNAQSQSARFGEITIARHTSTADTGNNCFNTSHYTRVRDPIRLPNNVVFDLIPSQGVLVNRDGTFTMQRNVSSSTFDAAVDDRTNWGDTATSANCDIIIGRTNTQRKFGIDVVPSVGRSRGAVFQRGP